LTVGKFSMWNELGDQKTHPVIVFGRFANFHIARHGFVYKNVDDFVHVTTADALVPPQFSALALPAPRNEQNRLYSLILL